jgi:hypothetical protein
MIEIVIPKIVAGVPLQDLLIEIESVFDSKNFLSGNPMEPHIEVPGKFRPLTYKNVPLEKLFSCLQAETDDTQKTEYTFLNQALLDIRVSFGLLHGCTPCDFKDAIDSFSGKITAITDNSTQLVQFCSDLSKHFVLKQSKENFFFAIQTIIAQHVDTIIAARTLTLSRRDGLTELLLKVYKAGFFPFGWNFGEECILALNPYNYIDYFDPSPLD